MKAYTDIEQSKKLAEFLPLESADMRYSPLGDNMHPWIWTDTFIEKNAAPCWSLAALLDIIPYGQVNKMAEDDNKYEAVSWNETDFDPILFVEGFDTPVDACYELILKLHEQKLL